MLFVVTNRRLTKNYNDFIERIKLIVSSNINGIILREKDLDENNYEILLKNILSIINNPSNIIVNNYINVAYKLNISSIQVSFYSFKLNYHYIKNYFKIIIVSVHSISEAIYASEKGANYIIIGHIFQTDCKKNVKPIGVNILKKIYNNINIPILAIGGINLNNISLVFKNKVSGVCLMSEIMKTKNVLSKIQNYKRKIKYNEI